MRPLRADARRSRQRILEVARAHDRQDLRHNDLAREAGVGVATVYRHFPTTRALVEALARDALERLSAACAAALSTSDPWDAVAGLVDDAVTIQLEDSGLQDVLVGNPSDLPEIRAVTLTILDRSEQVVRRAHEAGVLHADLTPRRLQYLVCGIEHAIRVGDPADRPALQEALLRGLRSSDV